MSKEAVIAFREIVIQSVGIQERIEAGEDLIAIAAAAGHVFTEEEFSQAWEEINESGLNDFELGMVSGGGVQTILNTGMLQIQPGQLISEMAQLKPGTLAQNFQSGSDQGTADIIELDGGVKLLD